MTTTDLQHLTLDELTDAWVAWFKQMIPEGYRPLAVPLERELTTTGQPVDPRRLADLAGVPLERALAGLRDAGFELDSSGGLLDRGLTLTLNRSSPHRSEVHGHTVWTDCVGDSLLLPVLIGASVRTQSPCAATGDPIHVDVTPTSVERVEPASAVVSVVTPSTDPANALADVCSQQNFYRSVEVAAPWQANNPQGRLLPVADAFEMFRRGGIELWGEELSSC